MIVGLVSTTGRDAVSRCVASLSDCDRVIVVDDKAGRGQAAVRNELLASAPAGSIVRFVDDDDIAMSTRVMADRLVASGADVLAASFISGSTREEVPTDPLAAAVDSVGPWSWVARVDALRSVPWDNRRTRSTGTWHWLSMIDAGLRFAFAPDVWCYHWLAAPDGASAACPERMELFAELGRRIDAAGRVDLRVPLAARMMRAGVPVDPSLRRLASIGTRFKATFGRYPSLAAPRTFSEKVAARKACGEDPRFVTWSDKLAGRRWAADLLGVDRAPPILDVVERVPDALPPRCFAKANHASGWFFPYVAGEHDVDTARATIGHWLAAFYGVEQCEEEYLEALRLVILEELLPGPVRDVRAFVFGGRVEFVACDLGWKTPAHRRDYFDRENQWQETRQIGRNDPAATRLDDLGEVIALADVLGAGIDFVRVDFVEAAGRLYFVEMSPFPSGGNAVFSRGFDDRLGALWR